MPALDISPAGAYSDLQTSYSDLTRHDMCARSWWLGAYLALRPVDAVRTGPLPFGSRIHLALEVTAKRDAWDREAIGDVWNILMEREFDAVRESGGYEKNLVTESKMGYAMLTNFVEWREQTHQAAKYKIIGVESKYGEHIDLTLPDGRTVKVLFRGKLDVLEQRQADGAIIIVDWKTAANLAEVTLRTQELSVQGPMYFMLVEMDSGDTQWLWGVSYVMLRKVAHGPTSKPPYYTRLDVQITPDRMAAARRNLIGKTIKAIQTGERLAAGEDPDIAAPYSVGWYCHSCPFRQPCGLMQRGNQAGARDLLHDRFEEGDIFERYNREETVLSELL